jgi:hypothetical protein
LNPECADHRDLQLGDKHLGAGDDIAMALGILGAEPPVRAVLDDDRALTSGVTVIHAVPVAQPFEDRDLLGRHPGIAEARDHALAGRVVADAADHRHGRSGVGGGNGLVGTLAARRPDHPVGSQRLSRPWGVRNLEDHVFVITTTRCVFWPTERVIPDQAAGRRGGTTGS